MKTFKVLQEFLDYIPKCIICGKERKLSMEGYVKPISSSKPRWSSGSQRVYLTLDLKDGYLHSTHKSHSVQIDPSTNKLLDGEDLINRMMLQTINVKKCCPTCVFKSFGVYQAGHTKKTHHFPPLALRSDDLNYTMPGGKHVTVAKFYSFNETIEDAKCHITIDKVALQPIPLDFARLTDLETINRKIKTITVFS